MRPRMAIPTVPFKAHITQAHHIFPPRAACCSATYMLIISSRFPEALPDLIAYQLLIIKQAKRFRYPSWLYYDIEFRKWAAATKTKEWAHINSEIYTLAFTGQGTVISWCPTCQVDRGNLTYDCPNYSSSNFSLPIPKPPTAPPASQPSPYQKPAAALRPLPAKKGKLEHFILYNKNNGACPYGYGCSFIHKCSYCGMLGHPVGSCPQRKSY